MAGSARFTAILDAWLADRAFEASDSEFVRFKTTRRAHYDHFAPVQPDVFDTLLWNRQGELTECTRGNIALQLEGRWVTPPLRCGLLGGVGHARTAQSLRRIDSTQMVLALAVMVVDVDPPALTERCNVLEGLRRPQGESGYRPDIMSVEEAWTRTHGGEKALGDLRQQLRHAIAEQFSQR
jgi:hypothetical protein